MTESEPEELRDDSPEEIGEGNGADVEEEDEDEGFMAPILDGRDITFQTTLVNRCLSCPLCHGYLREPVTVTECIHSFCKVCLFRHFALKQHDCPVCGEHLGPNPHERTLPDRQLASLIAKVFPALVAEDAKAEEEFYRSRGLKRPGELLAGQPAQTKPPAVQRVLAAKPPGVAVAQKRAAPPPSDDISFQLMLDEREPRLTAGLAKLDKPLITTSRRATMNHIKKFLLLKLKNALALDDLDLLYQGEILGGEHSLDFVVRRKPPRHGDMPTLHYRRRALL